MRLGMGLHGTLACLLALALTCLYSNLAAAWQAGGCPGCYDINPGELWFENCELKRDIYGAPFAVKCKLNGDERLLAQIHEAELKRLSIAINKLRLNVDDSGFWYTNGTGADAGSVEQAVEKFRRSLEWNISKGFEGRIFKTWLMLYDGAPRNPKPQRGDIACTDGSNLCRACQEYNDSSNPLCKKYASARSTGQSFPSCYVGPNVVYTDATGKCLDFKKMNDGDTFYYKGVPIRYVKGHSGTFDEMVREQYDINKGSASSAVSGGSPSAQRLPDGSSSDGKCTEQQISKCSHRCSQELLACSEWKGPHAVLKNCTFKNITCDVACGIKYKFSFCFQDGPCQQGYSKNTDDRFAYQIDPENVKRTGDFIDGKLECP